MFTKKFKLKSSNPQKSSFRKTLIQKLQASYPNLTEDDFKEMIPQKSSITSVKIVNSADENLTVFTVDNIPCILEINEVLYPTIYALWRCPNMLKFISVEPHLAGKLQEGLIHVRRSHLPAFGGKLPRFSKGEPLLVNTVDNEAAILIGTAQYSSEDMLIVQTGVCIKTINILGDFLCNNEKFTRVDRPQLQPPQSILFNQDDISKSLSHLTVTNSLQSGQNVELSSDLHITSESKEITEENMAGDGEISLSLDDTIASQKVPDDMDEMLKYCLLCVLKAHGKNLELPLKTNLLYANYMQLFCSSEKPLDIKKSTYKKLSKFLNAMQEEGLIQVKEVEKGVDAIISINLGHNLVKEHVVCIIDSNLDDKNEDSGYKAPKIVEVFKITAAVLPLFTPVGLKKGQTISPSNIRAILVDYVKRNNMQDPQNKNVLIIDPFFGTITNGTKITWEDLMTAILDKMTACSEICHPDGKSRLLTGKLKPITMQVANRAGNKKVTIVSNLEEYGISLNALSKECQHGVAASCTITKTPGSKTDQLLVQGNQTYFIAKHLTEVYGMPKKYIEGADKILSKKKK